MDVDPEADRIDLGDRQDQQGQGERRHGGRLLLEEEILEQLREHLTEELPYLKKDKLRGQHLREQSMLLEVKHLQVEDKLQELTDNLNLQYVVH